MEKLKGYKTIIANLVALVFSVLAVYGVQMPDGVQAEVVMLIFAILNLFLRVKTDSPVGDKVASLFEILGRITSKLQSSKNKQDGRVSVLFLPYLLLFAVVLLVSLQGCSLAPTQPVVDCISVSKVTNQKLAACYSSVESAAKAVKTAYESNLVNKETKQSLTNSLDDAYQYILVAEGFKGVDDQKSESELKLAVEILNKVSMILSKKENKNERR